jgi:hypothetical protein
MPGQPVAAWCWCVCRQIIAAINKVAVSKGQATSFKADFVGGEAKDGKRIYYGEGPCSAGLALPS